MTFCVIVIFVFFPMFPSFGQLVQPRGVSLHINCNLQHTEFTMYSSSRSSVFTQTYNYANLEKWEDKGECK